MEIDTRTGDEPSSRGGRSHDHIEGGGPDVGRVRAWGVGVTALTHRLWSELLPEYVVMAKDRTSPISI